jgi:hypothetical protein
LAFYALTGLGGRESETKPGNHSISATTLMLTLRGFQATSLWSFDMQASLVMHGVNRPWKGKKTLHRVDGGSASVHLVPLREDS